MGTDRGRDVSIDPALQQDELTSLVEPLDGEPFVLTPRVL
jgi:dCTP deaminase